MMQCKDLHSKIKRLYYLLKTYRYEEASQDNINLYI